jgi:hypothetical protein
MGLIFVAVDEWKLPVLSPLPRESAPEPCLRFENVGVGKNLSLCQEQNSRCLQSSREYNRQTALLGTEQIVGVRWTFMSSLVNVYFSDVFLMKVAVSLYLSTLHFVHKHFQCNSAQKKSNHAPRDANHTDRILHNIWNNWRFLWQSIIPYTTTGLKAVKISTWTG